jgi:AAA ATPase domain
MGETLVAISSQPVMQPPPSAPQRLLLKLRTTWQQISESSAAIAQASTAAQQTPSLVGDLRATRDQYDETTRALLAAPLGRFLQLQPIKSALETMQACDQETASAAVLSRSGIDARFYRLVTVATLDLCEPWRIWRAGNHPAEWHAWHSRRGTYDRQASALLEKYSHWSEAQPFTATAETAKPNNLGRDKWWQQHRALLATVALELALRDLTLAWFTATDTLVNDIRLEREALQAYRAAALMWLLEGAQPGEAAGTTFALVTPEERVRRWSGLVEADAQLQLPEQVQLLTGIRWLRLRSVPARSSFRKAFDAYARTPMSAIIEQSWELSARRLREAEQAKEMIAYWREAGRPGEAPQLLEEARQNAIASLSRPDDLLLRPEELDAAAAASFRGWQQKSFLVLEAQQFGWLSLALRPRARALLSTVLEIGQLRGRRALEQAGRWTRARFEDAMEAVGGRIPEHPSAPPVVRRTTLRDTLALPASRSELPPLYRLLFRLAPVEDRRFLVGRDRELAGIDQAVKDWAAGRFAACLLVGARGSGKSSLLNCATRETLDGYLWIRAEFSDRLLTPDQLEGFLRQLLQLPGDADLEQAFHSQRRVIILEETERIYLRKVGGFAAAHHFMHLIHRTAATTLWIVVMNDRSFRALDAGTQWHRVFSHRINAMNISRVDLENAILERHRLSGLRLEFASRGKGNLRLDRLKRLAGLEDSPRKMFFDSLYQQSEGIFRSAFELWLSSVELVEGDVIRMRQPFDPSFNKFRSELAQEDHLTMLLIQEHGSLTEDELAEVLCEPFAVSRGRLERLTAMGLVEHDPDHPGTRIRPEAQRFVNDLLRRANLT